MKFIVDKSYWNLFPDSKLGVLLLKNIQNGESTDEIKSILKEANNEAKKYLTKEKRLQIEPIIKKHIKFTPNRQLFLQNYMKKFLQKELKLKKQWLKQQKDSRKART